MSIRIPARNGAVVCKRNRVDIFGRLSTMYERDRQTDRPQNRIAISEIAFDAASRLISYEIARHTNNQWKTKFLFTD